MNRKNQAKKIENRIQKILKNNPEIKEALRVFGISNQQYLKTLQGDYSYYTSTSTSPSQVGFRTSNK